MNHSKFIIQQPEDVEAPNTFDIESVTIEHPKSTPKLSKPINHTKIITEKLKYKLKDYKENKKVIVRNSYNSLKYVIIFLKIAQNFAKLKFEVLTTTVNSLIF